MKLILLYERFSRHSVGPFEDGALVDISESTNTVGVSDDVEALEVGDPLAVSVGEAGKGLLVDLLDSLEISGNVALSSALTVEDERVAGVNIALASSELASVGGDVRGGLAVGLLEGRLVDVAAEHGVLDGAVLGSEAGNLGACAGAVLSGVLVAEGAGAVDLGVGHHRFLGVDASLVLHLGGAGLLVGPAEFLLVNGGIEALNDDTAFLTVLLEVGSGAGGTNLAEVGVRVEALAGPVVLASGREGVGHETAGSPFLLLLVSASASAELTVDDETPSDSAGAIGTAVLGGRGNTTRVGAGLGEGGTGKEGCGDSFKH